MILVDLHTHSVASPDGSLKLQDYDHALSTGLLDVIAITDHDTIDFALEARARLGEGIIVGEEVSTSEGEIVGLYLSEPVEPGLSVEATIAAIKSQGGLVYVPHPFETVRNGLNEATLNRIADSVDIIEVHNGRAVFQNRAKESENWAATHNVVVAASSDAHGKIGWGRTYTEIDSLPTIKNLVAQLQAGKLSTGTVGLLGVLYPKINRLKARRRGAAV